MSLWCTKFCGIFPCCPIAGSRRKSVVAKEGLSEPGKQTAFTDIVSQQPKSPPKTVITAARSEEYLKELYGKFISDTPEMDPKKLHDLLNGYFVTGFQSEGFSHDLCRSMVAMRDIDQSGSMGFDEFLLMWKDLETWRDIFMKLDGAKKGHFDKSEFHEIFKNIGLDLAPRTVQALSVRYSNKEGHVQFMDFVSAALRLQLMRETWKSLAGDESTAKFKTDEFIQLSLFA